MFKSIKQNKGFTLIEILVVIGIIAILATIVIIAINPARQFAQTRNSQRTSNVNAVLNAIGQRIADNKGIFEGTFTVGVTTYTCSVLPTASTTISYSSGGSTTSGDLGCLIPTYISSALNDPNGPSNYLVVRDSTTGRTTISAPSAELGETISVTR